MSHRSSKKRSESRYSVVGREVSNTFARRSLPLSRISVRDLRPIEDRRDFHPDYDHRAPKSYPSYRTHVRVKSYQPVNLSSDTYQAVPWRTEFVKPQEVITCVKRKIRREVLHALLVAGKRGLGRPHYNLFSKVSC